jgi:hypothetical protein
MSTEASPTGPAEICGKVGYATKRKAEQAGKDITHHRKTRHKPCLPLRAYACPICDAWHLTKSNLSP